MKTKLLLVVSLLITLPSFIKAQLPAYPAKSREAVVKFMDDLSARQASLNEQINKFSKENDAVGEQIDPSKMTAAYGMTQDVNALMERQKRSMDNQAKNQQITQKTLGYDAQYRVISDSLTVELNAFSLVYTDYVNHCIGIENSSCAGYESKKNQLGDEILTRYFFGNSAKFMGWLNAFIGDIPTQSKDVMIGLMSIQEETLGVTFPHKTDLAALEEQKAIIDAILNVFGEIDLKLFPGFN